MAADPPTIDYAAAGVAPVPRPFLANRVTWVVLLAILTLAAVVRVRYADRFASYDELWHLALTTGHGSPFGEFGTDVLVESPRSQTSLRDALPFWKTWTTMDGVLHPPLYIVTLRLWRDVFGESEAAARAYSNFWGLLAVLFSFLAARVALGRGLALWVALALALAPTQVYFGQEMRSYAMLVAIASAAFWLMTRIAVFGESRRDAIWLGAMPLLLLLTHYLGVGTCIAIALFGVVKLRAHRRAFLAALVASAALYAVIWLPFAIRQLHSIGTGDSFLKVKEFEWLRQLDFFLRGPYRLLIDRPPEMDRATLVTGVAFVLPWLLGRRLPVLRWWGAWLACSIGLVLLLDVSRRTEHLAYVRYLAVATPAVLPAFLGCAAVVDRRLATALAAVLALGCAIYLNGDVGVAAESPTMGEVAWRMKSLVKPGDAILTYRGKGEDWAGQVVQLHLSHEPGIFPRPIMDITGPVDAETRARLPRRVWIIQLGSNRSSESLLPGSRKIASYGVDVFVQADLMEQPSPATTATTTRAD